MVVSVSREKEKARKRKKESRAMLHGHCNIEMDDTWTHDKYFKIYMIRVFDTRVGYISDTIQLHDRSVRAT